MAEKLSSGQVTVKEHSKYGFKDSEEAFWGMSSTIKKEQFIPGVTYNVTYATSAAGNRYIRTFEPASNAPAAPPVKAPAAKVEPRAASGKAPSSTAENDPEYWSKRNNSIECQAVVKAVLGAPALAAMAGDIDGCLELADKMFAWGINKVKAAG